MHKNLRSTILNFAYDLLYHPFAWAYDFVAASVSWGYWQEWVRITLDFLEGPRVLELGFGPGHLQRWLTERGISAFGVDTSSQMANIARKRANQLSLAFSQALPFPNTHFDQIVATFPSNTILHLNTIREAWRVIKPGGRFIVLPIAWTHRIRKQNPLPWDDQLLDHFSKAGFKARTERVTRNSWSLVIIIAEKQL